MHRKGTTFKHMLQYLGRSICLINLASNSPPKTDPVSNMPQITPESDKISEFYFHSQDWNRLSALEISKHSCLHQLLTFGMVFTHKQ
jgi:hypothetical protein